MMRFQKTQPAIPDRPPTVRRCVRLLRHQADHYPARGRAGFSLVEAIVALLILSSVTVVLLPTLKLATRENDRTRYLTHCLIEMQNLKMRAALRNRPGVSDEPEADLTAALADKMQLSRWFQQQYPEASLTFERVEEADLGLDSGPDKKVDASRASSIAIRITITRFPETPQDSQRKSLVMWIPSVAATP